MTQDKEEAISIKLGKEQLMKKRVIYVGDRVAFGVVFSFLVLFGYISLVYRRNDIIMMNPWFFLFLIILGFLFFLWYVLTNDEFYFSEHIFLNSNFIYVQLIWICWMSVVTSFFALFYGWQHVIEITVLYLLMYIVGYISGRFLWLNWDKLGKNSKIYLIFFLVIAVLITTIIVGSIFLNAGNLRMCIFVYLFGIGSLGSMGLNAFMLYLYYDKSGNDVLEDPPSLLVIIGIINTLIISFIVWLIMVIFIPFIPGSKRGSRKKGGSSYHKKGSSSGGRFPRIYRTRRYYFFGPKIEEERPSVDHYWQIAMGIIGTEITYKKAEVDEAKNKIIDLLFEEEIIPSQKDLQNISKINPPLIDFALDELIKENKIKYTRQTASHWWTKGYSLTVYYYNKLIEQRGLVDKEKLEKDFDKKVEIFLKVVKEREPIKTRYQLWDLAVDIGLSPKWKITPTLNKLVKQKKIKYSRKIPKGYYIP